MTSALLVAVLVVGGLLTLWAAGAAAMDREPSKRLLQGLLGFQLLLLVQLAAVLVAVANGERPAETGAFAGYVVLSLLLLPGGLALTVDERSRYGTLVMAVACLTVVVVELRLDATW